MRHHTVFESWFLQTLIVAIGVCPYIFKIVVSLGRYLANLLPEDGGNKIEKENENQLLEESAIAPCQQKVFSASPAHQVWGLLNALSILKFVLSLQRM